MDRIAPPDSIAAWLNLDPCTDTVVVRRHVRYIDGMPAIISDDYVDERITRMPTPAQVKRLGISTRTPVAEHIRTGCTAQNWPVRVMVPVIPAMR